MKNLVSSIKRRIDPLSIYIRPEPVIDNFKINIMSSGSCFAIATSDHFQRLGISSFFDLRTCFRFSARSFADYFEYLNSKDADAFLQRLHLSGSAPFQLLRSTAHAEIVESPENSTKLHDEIRSADRQFVENLQAADIVIFTLGTSIYLRTKETHQVMNTNEGFSRDSYEIVTPDTSELTSDIRYIVQSICSMAKPNARIFFTISPQRYSWVPMGDFRNGREAIAGDESPIPNDGLVNNCYDKSRMRVLLQDAITEFSESYPNIRYFPSYEIVMDELRHLENFGIKEADFGHVSQDTSSHVINRFLNIYMSESMKEFIEKFRKEESLLDQRFSYQNTNEYTKTIKKYVGLLADFQSLNIPQMYLNKIRISMDKYSSKLDHKTSEEISLLKKDLMNSTNHIFNQDINYKCQKIEEIDNNTPIYIYGTGDTAEEILRKSVVLKRNLKGFVHSKESSKDNYFGYPVKNIKEASFESNAIIAIASLGSADVIAEVLFKHGIEYSKMI